MINQYIRAMGVAAGRFSRPLAKDGVFHNARTAPEEVLVERPWHRLACEMALNGCDCAVIAHALDKSQARVRIILMQPWARKYMEEQAKKRSACDEIKLILEEQGVKALQRVVYTAEKNAGTSLGLDADRELLNRLLGKPTQPIQQESPPAKELEFDELQRRVAGLVGGVSPPSDNPD